MSFILLGILNSQVEAEAGGAYELISSQVLSSSASSVTFSSIPQTYKHLQIRTVARSDSSSTSQLRIRLNGDTANNYALHTLTGNGSSVSSGAATSVSFGVGLRIAQSTTTANVFGVGVHEILDYTSTTKNTTIKGLGGSDTPVDIRLASGLWINTSAITSLNLSSSNGNLVSGSRFSLYGIRG